MQKFSSTVRKHIGLAKFKIMSRHFTDILIDRYCKGYGIEIGPGSLPYGGRETTVYFDKYDYYVKKDFKLDIVSDAASIPRPDASFDYLALNIIPTR